MPPGTLVWSDPNTSSLQATAAVWRGQTFVRRPPTGWARLPAGRADGSDGPRPGFAPGAPGWAAGGVTPSCEARPVKRPGDPRCRVSSPLDTNRCSCCHGRMTNVCSPVAAPAFYPRTSAETLSSHTRRAHHPRPAPGTPEAPAGGRGIGAAGSNASSWRCAARPGRMPQPRTGGAGRRREVLVLGVLAVTILVLLALPWGGAGGHVLATPGPALVGDPVRGHSLYVVQPGDTLWSIAERLSPGSDPRAMVATLAAEAGGEKLVPGERLLLP